MAGRRHHTGAAPPSSGGPSRAHLQRVDEFRWEIPRSYKAGMRVSARVYASEPMLAKLIDDKALEQIVNVAHLPGIVGYALAMPDVHWGYGFPIGGVAAMDAATGVVSPGGIGFDINCGVRLIRSGLTEAEVRPRLDALLDALFAAVPSGVGSRGRIALSKTGIERVLRDGAQWAVREGYGRPHDIDVTEEAGRLASADPAQVSDRAKERGAVQLGTLGSGNHFLEVQVVDEIFDPAAATALGLALEQVVIFIHTGSRGCGYQICEDYLASFARSPFAQAIPLPDRQLVCAPIDAPEGRAYLAAMACGANFAWANRQCITHWAREAFAAVLGRSATALGLDMVYDVAHNIAKIEEHT
ncbi:MAG: RtcB family protein, partial [Actinobacteria bacterium]|nr:RtcB family protein [Actinomycetota bacterium]